MRREMFEVASIFSRLSVRFGVETICGQYTDTAQFTGQGTLVFSENYLIDKMHFSAMSTSN